MLKCNYPFERNLINKKKKVKVTPYATIPIPIPRNLSNIKYAAEIDYWKHLTCYKFNFNKKTKTFRCFNINSVCPKHLVCFKLNFNKKSKTLFCSGLANKGDTASVTGWLYKCKSHYHNIRIILKGTLVVDYINVKAIIIILLW